MDSTPLFPKVNLRNLIALLLENFYSKFDIIIDRYQVDSLSVERRFMITVTKRDLIELGYGPSFAADIIKKAKELMVEKGHTYYQSRKLDRVPKEAVEELLGITLPDKQE